MPEEPKRPPRISGLQIARSYGLAFEAAIAIVVGAVLGIFADKWLGTGPWLLLVFIALGLFTAVRRLMAIGKEAGGDGNAPRS